MLQTNQPLAIFASFSRQTKLVTVLCCICLFINPVYSQQIPEELPAGSNKLPTITPQAVQKEKELVDSILDAELVFNVEPTRSRIMRTKLPIERIAFTDPSIVDVNEFSPYEVEIIGLKAGETTLTMWFKSLAGKETIIRYLVKVGADESAQDQAIVEYTKLQGRVNELFPNSHVQLIPVADKLIVRGQAKDAKEAAEILAVIGGQSVDQQGNLVGGFVNLGAAAKVGGVEAPSTNVINLLHIPGEQQVMLKVRIAELNRKSTREFGLDFRVGQAGDTFNLTHFLGGGIGNLSAILSSGDVRLFLRALNYNDMGKLLAEPTLVTLSGKPATFISGGEFPVQTAVGVDGVGAVATTYRGFGTQLTFTPTVTDKDKIRLQVAPTVTSLGTESNFGFLLNGRSTATTVDLREGQWLAIAGLIQEEQQGGRTRLPYLGDIPLIGAAFGTQSTERAETELVILVSPELVHPMEPEQVPLFLPGMDVTDPTDREFYFHQQFEGLPNRPYRSTVWPTYRHQRLHAKWDRHGDDCYTDKFDSTYQQQQQYYMSGSHGFTK